MMFRILIISMLVGVALSVSLPHRVRRAENYSEGQNNNVQERQNDRIMENGDNTYVAPKQNYQFPLAGHYQATYPEYTLSPLQYNPAITNPPNTNPTTGNSNYIVATVPQLQNSNSWSSRIASGLVPLGSFALTYGGKVILVILQFFMLVLVGLVLTTTICTLTPFCSINFAGLGINNKSVRNEVGEMARTFMTPDNINMLTYLVTSAMEKVNAQTQKDSTLSTNKEKSN